MQLSIQLRDKNCISGNNLKMVRLRSRSPRKRSRRKVVDPSSSQAKKLKSQISSMEKLLQSVSSRLDTLGEDSVMVSDIAAAIADNAPAGRPAPVSTNTSSTNSRNDYTAAAVAVQSILKRKRDDSS